MIETGSEQPSPAEEPDERRRPFLQALIARLGERLRHWNGEVSLRESLEEVIEEHEDDGDEMTAEERLMLMNILSIGELRAEDVMVPRADIVAVEGDSSLGETVAAFRRAGHSRLPIYRETLDDPLGMVHLKDLIAWWPQEGAAEAATFSLQTIRRDVLFVPPSMPVLDLLIKMRTSGIHLALVIDEYGGTDGLVTIEDIVEQIVGELGDEHGANGAPELRACEDGSYDADARVPIEELQDTLGLRLFDEERDEDIDTLGGLVVSLAGRVPQRGELIAHPAGVEFEVIDADPRRLKQLRVRRTGRTG